MVIAGAANVLVDQDRRLARRRWGVLAAVLQDGGDGAVGAGAENQRAGTGSVDPLDAEAFDQADNADAGAEALLGMRPRSQDHVDQHRCVGADQRGLAADALMGPIAIAPVRARHVVGDGGGPMQAQAALMAGDPLAAMEDLDGRDGDPRLDLLADQLVRHAVVVLGDLDKQVAGTDRALFGAIDYDAGEIVQGATDPFASGHYLGKSIGKLERKKPSQEAIPNPRARPGLCDRAGKFEAKERAAKPRAPLAETS